MRRLGRAASVLALWLAGACGGGTGGGGGGNVDPAVQHNLDVLNMYRAQAGVAPLTLDATLTAFSTTATQMLHDTGQAHAYFQAEASAQRLFGADGFCGNAAENQAPAWRFAPDENGAIDAVLAGMMAEGPGGGHHDNILDGRSTRVGIGLLVDTGKLWLTNDFSGPCR